MTDSTPETDFLARWETGVMDVLNSEDAEFFQPVRRLLAEITDSVRKKVEVFIPVNGGPETPEGSFLWGYLLEHQQFLSLNRVVETVSNGEMTCAIEPGRQVGIRIGRKSAA